MCDFKTKTITVIRQEFIEKIVAILIHHSQWFAVMPLPDDYWELSVKKEEYLRYVKVYKRLLTASQL